MAETPETKPEATKTTNSGGGFFKNIKNRIVNGYKTGEKGGIIRGTGKQILKTSALLSPALLHPKVNGKVASVLANTSSSLLSTLGAPATGNAVSTGILGASAWTTKVIGSTLAAVSSPWVWGSALFAGGMGLGLYRLINGKDSLKLDGSGIKKARNGLKGYGERVIGETGGLVASALGSTVNIGKGLINGISSGLFGKKIFKDTSYEKNKTTDGKLDNQTAENIETQKQEALNKKAERQAEKEQKAQEKAEKKAEEQAKKKEKEEKNEQMKKSVENLEKSLNDVRNKIDNEYNKNSASTRLSIHNASGIYGISSNRKRNDMKELMNKLTQYLHETKGELSKTKKRLFRKNIVSLREFGMDRVRDEFQVYIEKINKVGGNKYFTKALNTELKHIHNTLQKFSKNTSEELDIDKGYEDNEDYENDHESNSQREETKVFDLIKQKEEAKKIESYNKLEKKLEKSKKKLTKSYKDLKKFSKKTIDVLGGVTGASLIGGFFDNLVFSTTIGGDPVATGTANQQNKVKKSLKNIFKHGKEHSNDYYSESYIDNMNYRDLQIEKGKLKEFKKKIKNNSTDASLKTVVKEVTKQHIENGKKYLKAKEAISRISKPEGYDNWYGMRA